MTYTFTQDVPIDEHFYKRVTDGLGPERPKGLITHIAIKRPEGGLRYIDVWESEEDCDRFGEERLHPVVHPLIQKNLRWRTAGRARARAAVRHPRVGQCRRLQLRSSEPYCAPGRCAVRGVIPAHPPMD